MQQTSGRLATHPGLARDLPMSITRYAVFILLRATEQWLRLSREARRRLSDEHVGTALRQLPALKLRYFDAEAFSADCSDIMLTDLQQHYDFIERLRDSPLVTAPYFEFVKVVLTIEDGFRGFEERQP
jgi:hypothetical protein